MATTPSPPLLKRLPMGVWLAAFWIAVVVARTIQREDELRHLVRFDSNMENGSLLVIMIVTTLVGFLVFRWPLAAVAVALAGFCVTLNQPVFLVPDALYLLADVLVGHVAATGPRRRSAAALMLPVGLLAGSLLFRIGRGWETEFAVHAGLVSTTVIAWLIGNTIHQTRAHQEALRFRATEEAVTAERLRIARELHDMVAHSIGIIAIQAGVGGRVMETQPAETRAALDAIEVTSRETLTGLRRLLGALRQADTDAVAGTGAGTGPAPVPYDPAPGLADLERLAARTLEAAGVRVHIRWHGERRPLPAPTELSAYRIVQESVTNVVRHAGTRDCSVTVGYEREELTVEVVDLGCADGTGVGAGAGSGARAAGGHAYGSGGHAHGYGIVGMRERVSLLNGEFSAGPREGGGFRVAARLPVPAAGSVPAPAAGAAPLAGPMPEAVRHPVDVEAPDRAVGAVR